MSDFFHLYEDDADNVIQWEDGANRVLFTITPDGDVELGEGVEWTEAARAFWALVAELKPDAVVPRSVADALAKAALTYADEPEKGSGVYLRRAVERYRNGLA